jgi:low temperature requirement protein LtrA
LKVLRERSGDASPRVTHMELFFDLVYVFAITQLSDFLFAHRSARGALEGLILFLAVWWAWNYTAWATNWIDPERPPVALLMVVLMAISLVMSAAIPEAFGARGLAFAAAYVLLQLIRSSFVVAAFPKGERMRRNYAQLLAWSAIAGVPWIAGAFVHGDARIALWVAALIIDLAAPAVGFRLPGVDPTPIEDWTLAGAHLAERCQLVLMIALGESVLRVGLTFSEQRGTVAVDGAFVVGFIASAALWGTYFLRHAESGAAAISGDAAAAARVGRAAYAYAHAVMVAGVIIVAVAVRLTIDDPGGEVTAASGLAMLGGPALYLAGLLMFKRWVHRGALGPPVGGIAVLALLTVAALAGVDRLVLCVLATLVLVALAVGAQQDTAAA